MPLRDVGRAITANLNIGYRGADRCEEPIMSVNWIVEAVGEWVRQCAVRPLAAVDGGDVIRERTEAERAGVRGRWGSVKRRDIHDAESGPHNKVRRHAVSNSGSWTKIVVVRFLIAARLAIDAGEHAPAP